MQNPLSVILIEDDKDSCKALEDYFEGLDGIKIVKTTNSSSQALEYVCQWRPDAVILDLELHNGSGSGIAFLSGLNRLLADGIPKPYVLVTTNNSSQTTYQAIRRLGADFILYKHQEDYSPKTVSEILLDVCLTESFDLRAKAPRRVSEISAADLRKRICEELDSVNISPRQLGYTYLADAIEIYTRERVTNVSALIGQKYHKTEASVERAMQNAINRAWSKSDIHTLEVHYTGHINPTRGVPTILEFVCHYAKKIKNDVQ